MSMYNVCGFCGDSPLPGIGACERHVEAESQTLSIQLKEALKAENKAGNRDWRDSTSSSSRGIYRLMLQIEFLRLYALTAEVRSAIENFAARDLDPLGDNFVDLGRLAIIRMKFNGVASALRAGLDKLLPDIRK